MKLKDIIETAKGKYAPIDFDSKWLVDDNGNICIKTPIPVNIEDEVEIVYHWYHHMIDKEIVDDIQNAIDTHDYETFMKYANKDVRFEFFPIDASIYANGKFVGNIAIFAEKEVFSLITYSECECG